MLVCTGEHVAYYVIETSVLQEVKSDAETLMKDK